MKYYTLQLVLVFSLFFASFSYGQKQENFREKEFLILKDDKFLTTKNDPTVYLKKLKKNGTKKKKSQTSETGDLITTYYTEEVQYDSTDFKASDFGIKLKRLKGDFKIKKSTLHFYPWDFNDKNINKELDKYEYIISIPDRTVVGVKFYGYQFGSLTLPAKVFLASKADTLVNNIQTSVNLNAFVGIKWGKRKYYFLPNEDSGKVYERSFSANFVFGFSKIDISDKNTTPKLDETFSVAGFSPGIAFGFHYKKIGIYLVTGTDIPLSDYADEWNFKGKQWVGFGLGLGL